MKRFLTISLMAVLMTATMGFAAAPSIVRCGVDPVNVVPGQAFTVYADVSDSDGLSDVSTVGVIYNNQLVLTLPATETPGRYEAHFVMPANASSGTFSLMMAAADASSMISPFLQFSFGILGGGDPGVELLSPEEGYTVECEGPTEFAWAPYAGNGGIAAYTFSLFTPDGLQYTSELPPVLTSFTVPGHVWHLLPDGTYYWQVGVLETFGGEPIALSELRSFNVSCTEPMPHEVFGRVVALDAELGQITIASRWHHGPETVTIQVTDETALLNAAGEIITFDQIVEGQFAFATGEFVEELFFATQVIIEGEPGPGPADHVGGRITAIDAEARSIMITPRECPENGSMEPVTVQVTDETRIMGHHGEELTFEDLVIEMFALAIGTFDESGVLVADEIQVADVPGPGPGDDHVRGIIVQIDAENSILYVEANDHREGVQIAVQITENTELTGPEGPITFDQIQVDMILAAVGTWQEEILIAQHAHVMPGSPPGPGPSDHVYGLIAAIDADNHIVTLGRNCPDGQTVAVLITEETVLTDETGPITFDALEVGMEAMAMGEWTSEAQFTAAEMHVREGWTPPPPPPQQIGGMIQEINSETMQFQIGMHEHSVWVQVTEETVILAENVEVTFADLQIGQRAMCIGAFAEDLFVADQVFIAPHH